ncbi:MAG: TolC family protein [Sulfuricurvum sp.]|jgi:cobalt-zinc-cadmium efflux system outer membrane protein|uniref:TolC family protein n=1 Tax=Sulfuricurvum sp. TaxID=2025608 RepID=UPI0025D15BF4|nr:TolC family protein [Sulfuricurvum sp.]MCK9371824.1 TolC family protein [Sulfuricurvum sp.]
MNFDAAVAQFTQHNYDLLIARQEAQKSYANLITAKERPNPVLNGSYEFMNIKNHFSDTSTGSNAQATIILAHPIETGGKRDRRIDLAVHSITFNDFIYDETLRESLSSLIDTYYAVLSSQSDLANAEENARAYARVMVIAKVKLDSGFLSQMEYQKISLQQIDYIREIENNRRTLGQERENLALLLALPSSDISVTEPVSPIAAIAPLDEFLANIAERPDCKAAKENLAVAEAALKLEKANALPNITVGAEYASFGPDYQPLAGVNFSVPLPVYDRNEGDIERSRIGTLQAVNLYNKTLHMARTDVIQSYETAKSRETLYRIMEKGFIAAKELKEKQEKIFALKGISILELLDAQKSYRDYQKNLTHAAIDLHSAAVRLKLNSGSSLIDPKGH